MNLTYETNIQIGKCYTKLSKETIIIFDPEIAKQFEKLVVFEENEKS